jgi:epoxyqueuosine reductase
VNKSSGGSAVPATELTQRLKDEAHRLGFELAGVCSAVAPAGRHRLREWLAAGYAGTMRYFSDRLEAYDDPRYVLDGARSLLVLGMNYRTAPPTPATPGTGRVACYAWGPQDYHDVIHARLRQLADFLHSRVPDAAVRGVVDTAPLLEREFAQRAGLGWIGKNTLLINRHWGSWFFLAVLLTDQELVCDAPHAANHCGTCRACLDACPTGAFPEPYVLDARRCLSYLTIEHRGPAPADLRPQTGEWLFGCDACQDACPWNRRTPASPEAAFAPGAGMNPVDLCALFFLTDDEFRTRFRHTPLWRPKRRGLLRNAALVLGNQRTVLPPDAAPVTALARGLHDTELEVRAACAWALGRFDTEAALAALRQRLPKEPEERLRQVIREALLML